MKTALLIAVIAACWAVAGEMDYQDALKTEQAKQAFMRDNPHWFGGEYVQR